METKRIWQVVLENIPAIKGYMMNDSTKNKKSNIATSSPLLLKKNPLLILPNLAVAVGLNESIILQQLEYWIEKKGKVKGKENRKWIYNSYEKWQKKNFPFWSPSAVRRIVN